jgi:hypothetical protein
MWGKRTGHSGSRLLPNNGNLPLISPLPLRLSLSSSLAGHFGSCSSRAWWPAVRRWTGICQAYFREGGLSLCHPNPGGGGVEIPGHLGLEGPG